jgi:transposase-like protein
MANFNYITGDRFIANLSLGSRNCPECKVVSLHVLSKKEKRIECRHCKGEWTLKEDGYSLRRERWDNVRPVYLDDM